MPSPVREAALIAELMLRGVPCRTEVIFPISYKDSLLSVYYRADIICCESVIVEVKASSGLGPIDEAQAINYMKASGLRKGLVLNFAYDRCNIADWFWGCD
jgi:GxxExxY protein